MFWLYLIERLINAIQFYLYIGIHLFDSSTFVLPFDMIYISFKVKKGLVTEDHWRFVANIDCLTLDKWNMRGPLNVVDEWAWVVIHLY